MTDIIIYTNPKALLHKQDRLSEEDDDDKSNKGEYYWELRGEPSDLEQMDRIFFATEGSIKGFFLIYDFDWGDGFQVWFKSNSWKDIKPISIKHFQGFKYLTKDIAQQIEVMPNSSQE